MSSLVCVSAMHRYAAVDDPMILSRETVAKTFGNGSEKIIFLHGWLGTGSSFDSLHNSFNPNEFTLAFLDYRGYGLSQDIQGQFTIEEIGRDILAFADKHKWDKFHVVGHSMGGMAAQWVCANSPSRVKSAIGITPVPASGIPMDEQTWGFFFGAVENVSFRAAIVGNTTGNRHSPEWCNSIAQESSKTSTQESFSAYLSAWTKTDFHSKLSNSEIPFLAIVGAHDPAVSEQVIRGTIMQWFKHAELTLLASAGHYPMFEVPLELAALIINFVSKHK